jgi:alkylhydroperoxidase/carboxymuconolactone decarboxylase family protein YurZ
MIANKQVPMATNQHATAEELLEAVFSVVHAVTVAMQWHSKHASAVTVELKQ